MKQVININFQGRVIPIEVTAYEMVKNYMDTLKKHFSSEEGGDEIINDIEGRVGELFQEKIKSGASCITDSDVDAVIASIGRPEQFDAAEEKNTSDKTGQQSQANSIPGPKKLYRNEADKILAGVCSGLAHYLNIDVVIVRVIFLIFFGALFLPYIILWIVLPGSSTQQIGARTKKLFRDPDDKILAGVCSGLGKYFGIDAWIPRVIFLLPFLGYLFKWNENIFFFPNIFKLTLSPGAFTIYLILWLLIPKARTASEKLQMRGEKVDLNTLTNKITQGSKQLEKNADRIQKDLEDKAKVKAGEIQSEAADIARRGAKGIGSVLGTIFKTIIYIILGFAAFIAFIVILSLSVSFIAVFPLKNFLITTGWQNTLAWITLVLLAVVPLMAAVIWIIRRIARVRSHSRALRISFVSLWLLGLVSAGLLAASIAGDFRYHSKSDFEQIQLANPTAQSLAVVSTAKEGRYRDEKGNINITPEDLFDLDSIPLDNVEVDILKSEDDSFRVFVRTNSFGRNRMDAENRTNTIKPVFISTDSTLSVDPHIFITRQQKFRAQEVDIKIYVPSGKKITIDEKFDPDRISRWEEEVPGIVKFRKESDRL